MYASGGDMGFGKRQRQVGYALGPSKQAILDRVIESPGISGQELAYELGVSRQWVNCCLINLERYGLIMRGCYCPITMEKVD